MTGCSSHHQWPALIINNTCKNMPIWDRMGTTTSLPKYNIYPEIEGNTYSANILF